MAITLWGVQGTVNEVQWAKLATGLSQKYTLVSGNPITASGRTLTITPRLSVGCGVAVENSTNESVVTPVPTTGQWFLLCLRRVWGASRGASYVLVNGPTTADAVQAAPPTTLPGTRNSTPGVMDDEPVAWVHARASTTTLNIFQMSARPNAVVAGVWALWNGAEQGIYRAFSEADGLEYLWNGSSWQIHGERRTTWRDFRTLIGASAAWTPDSVSAPASIMREGDNVILEGNLTNGSAFATFTTLGTLPLGWRPINRGAGQYAYMDIDAVGAHVTKGMRILTSSGTIQVYASAASSIWGFWRCGWKTDDPWPS